MGVITEAARNAIIEKIAEHIRNEMESNCGKPRVVEVLKKTGRFVLRQLESAAPEWLPLYKLAFGVTMLSSRFVEGSLELPPVEFFDRSRFYEVGASQRTAARAIAGVQDMMRRDSITKEKFDIRTMKEFLDRYSERAQFTRVSNVGDKSADAIVAILRKAGMPFKYPDD